MFYKDILQENSILDIQEHNHILNVIVESIISTGNVDILDEISAKDIGAAFVQTIKKIAMYIIDAISIAFTFIGEIFNKNYKAFKKYQFLAKANNIDFNKEAKFITKIKSVNSTKPDNINMAIGKLDKGLIDILNGNSSDDNNKLLAIKFDLLRAQKSSLNKDGNIDGEKFSTGYLRTIIRNNPNEKIENVEHNKLASVCKNNTDIKKMLEFLSNRRPYTAMAITKRKARVECNKLIASVTKETGSSSNQTKEKIKYCSNIMKNTNLILGIIKKAYSIISKDYITILSVAASQLNKDDQKNLKNKEIKTTTGKVNGSSYINYD